MNTSRIVATAFVVAAFLAGAVPARAASADSRVTTLIAESGKVLGITALFAHHTMRSDAAVSVAGLRGTGTQYVDLQDGRFAERSEVGPFIQLDGYDGHDPWSGDGTKLVWTDGNISDRSNEINEAYISSYGLWRPDAAGAMVTWIGEKSAAGVSYDALSILPTGSKVPFELWFDRQTKLPARAVVPNNVIVATSIFSDYASFGGVMVPRKTHVSSSDGNDSDSTTVSVAFDAPGVRAHVVRPNTHPTDYSILDGKASTTVPIVLADNHVYLDVMLNGKGPYHFIFDTGGLNVMDPAVAKEIGAFAKGSLQGSGVGSQTETFSFAKVSTLQVGDAVLKDQQFTVVPTRQGFGVSAGRQIDGLIGWEVLARYVTTFDYANDRVVLSLPSAAPSVPSDGRVVPFVLFGTQPQIGCTIDGIDTTCTIDTGARDTISFGTPFVKAHPEIVPATLTAAGVDGFGVGGAEIGKLGRVTDVGIADFHMTDLVADFAQQTQGAMASPYVAANIGGNLLRRFTVTFDYGKQTMTLVPNAAFHERDAYERSGLFLIDKNRTIAVFDSRPGTPAADAGIVKGDTIVAIDGVAGTTLGQMRAAFERPAGTVVRLDLVGKDGSKRTVSVTLRDYV